MTLEEGKRKVYELLDEYGVGGEGVDSDIAAKMNDLFDIAQKEIAQRQRIARVYTVERKPDVTEYAMPGNFLKLRRVWRNGRPADGRYRWRGGALVIPARDTAVVEVEYFASPETIGPETEDSYEFEVREDACQAMPFYVAGMVLSSDLVQDAGIYLGLYQQMLQALDTTPPGGEARLRQALYRA